MADLFRHFDKKQAIDHAGASVKTMKGNSLLLKSKITCHMIKAMSMWFT